MSGALLVIGDPTFLGWFTFAAYLVAALFALRAWRVCRFATRRPKRAHALEALRQERMAVFWFGVALLMFLLGLNKELDLQRLVGGWGKAAALNQGWYEDRKSVQLVFIAALVLLSTGVLAGTVYFLRDVLDRIVLALAGVALIVAYALLRAAAFNVRNAVPAAGAASLWVLELLGIGLVIWSASRRAKAVQA